jgi:hypothetical protein
MRRFKSCHLSISVQVTVGPDHESLAVKRHREGGPHLLAVRGSPGQLIEAGVRTPRDRLWRDGVGCSGSSVGPNELAEEFLVFQFELPESFHVIEHCGELFIVLI